MIQKGAGPGQETAGSLPVKKLTVALTAAAVVLALLIFMIFQWAGGGVGPWRPFEPPGAENGSRRVILLLADRLTYGDLRRGAGSNLAQLFDRGAIALMNVRSGRGGSESGYLSIGTGARAVAGPEGRSAFERGEFFEGERAEIIFERCTGRPPAGALFHLQAAALQEKNSALPYPVTVGLLGEMLKAEGLTVAVWGNADGAAPNRSAVMMAMDSGGEVPMGALGEELLQEAPFFPYGARTDPEKLVAAVAEKITAADLHLIEFGDSSRLDDYWPYLTPARGEALFSLTMENLDLLLGKLLPLVDKGSTLLIVAPSLPLHRPAGGAQFTPVFLVTAAGPGPALLGSSATRRPGLVQNVDLVSMIHTLLGNDSGAASSYPATSFSIIPVKNPPDFLERFSAQATLVFNGRPALLKGYIAALVFVLLAGLAGLLLKIYPILGPVSWSIEVLLLFPPALLLLPGLICFPVSSALHSAIILFGAALVPALLWHPLQRRERRLYWALVGWSIALLLIVDTLAGAPLQQRSMFSYDPVGGARYYGIGNEYMGVLVGAALLGTIAAAAFIAGGSSLPGRDLRAKVASLVMSGAILIFYGIIILVLAAPNFGANLGGSLTAAVAFGASWAGLSGLAGQVDLCKKKIALHVTAFLFAAVGLLWLLNSYRSGVLPSHVGLFGEAVRSRGAAAFWETASRKMNMNLKLIRYSIWSRAFVTLVGLCVIFSVYPGGFRQRLRKEHPYLVTGVTAALAGAIAALMTNDSGVVAAATLLLYAVPPALITVIQKTFSGGQDKERQRQG